SRISHICTTAGPRSPMPKVFCTPTSLLQIGTNRSGGYVARLQVVRQLLEDRRLRACAHDLLDDLTVVVDIHGGYAGHAIFRRSDRVLVDVHLDQADLVAVFGRDLVEDGGNLAAGAAPFRPEVDENGL